MYSQTKLKRMEESINAVNLITDLTDEQVIWVKNKISQVEAWKDLAAAKFTEIDGRLNNIETQGVTLANRIKVSEDKITVFETKAAAAVIKFNQIDLKIAAIEARLTAHGI